MRPRSLKKAIESGYAITSVKHAYNSKVLVVVTKRCYPSCEGNNIEQYWIDRRYFMRNYPNVFERFTI